MFKTNGVSQKTGYLMIRVLRNPHLWVIAIIIAVLVIVHYHKLLPNVWLIDRIGSALELGLTRQTLERILFLIPVTYGAAVLGTGGGASILALAATAMFPRVFLISPAPREALFETGGVLLTGALIVTLFDFMQKGKQRLAELEMTQGMLNLQIKRLGMLHVFSSRVSQSLELPQVLNAARGEVRQVMEMEAMWLYLWDEEKRRLRLATSVGLSEGIVPETLRLGEGLDGVVAESRQPMTIDGTSANPKFRSTLPSLGSLQSVLIVPLIAKHEISEVCVNSTLLDLKRLPLRA